MAAINPVDINLLDIINLGYIVVVNAFFVLVLLKHRIKNRTRPSLLLLLYCIAYLCSQSLKLLAYSVFNSPGFILVHWSIRLVHVQFFYASHFLIVIFWDYVNSESVNLVKMMLLSAGWSVTLTGTIIELVMLESLPGYFGTYVAIVANVVLLNTFYYFTKILIKAPVYLKKPLIFIVMAGFIFIGIIFIIQLDILDRVAQFVLNMIFTTYQFSMLPVLILKYPQAMYILPFKVYRLTVIELEGGIPLFSRDWKIKEGEEGLGSDGLFSGMLHGVNLIMKESLNKGMATNIMLENGILILKKSTTYQTACVLVASKASRSLRNALDMFANEFFTTYGELLKSSPREVSAFDGAVEIMRKCFGFIPDDIIDRDLDGTEK
ncbi:MAG: hypothetical protein ACFFCS_17180 [Candidatus Hodarchaeota archaeon]